MIAMSVVSGLLLAGFCLSRIKAKRGEKPDVQTLFGRK
jgi:hypothetical protein